MKINIILPVNNPRILNAESLSELRLPKEITCEITLPKNNLLEITSAEEERIATPSIVDQVDTFVLGCGSMQSKGKKMRHLIKENYGYDVMIVDPLPTTLYFVSGIVSSKLSQSKQAYQHGH